MLRYTKEHAWVKREGETATLGITEYAQEQLGDIVYVDLPNAGATITQGTAMGTVESVKSVSELFAPVSGLVLETNRELVDKPEKLNQDPEDSAWLVRVNLTKPEELDGLLDRMGYRESTGLL